MTFELQGTDEQSNARAGLLCTPHGNIETPVFMPVGTQATVKTVSQPDLLHDTRAQIILANTYHLYLRPGTDILHQAGGLHRFNAWPRPMLTDSGGYQVYSLSHNRRIATDGVTFRSHIDGSMHQFTPERVVDIQRAIGADIIMPLDECCPGEASYDYAARSLVTTQQWLDRSFVHHRRTPPHYHYPQSLFPIIQGCTYTDLRTEAAQHALQYHAEGYAIGGLAVGEPTETMYAIVSHLHNLLPADRPRYLMGVGTPANILENIARGVDMFDCVMPSRNARNGQLFTRCGIINITNQRWREDHSPIDPDAHSYVDTLYSRAYLHHLFRTHESLGPQIATLHNLAFYRWLTQTARRHILHGAYTAWMSSVLPQLAIHI